MTHTPPVGPDGMAQSTTADPAAGADAVPAPRWVPVAALAIALVAVVLAIVGWFRPPTGPGKFSEGQTAQAKKDVCATVTNVRQAVGINTHRRNAQGDAAGALAVAANARLALYSGGAYLQSQLANEPATPDDLAETAEAMANTIQKLGIGYLADATETNLQPLRDDLTDELDKLNDLCT